MPSVEVHVFDSSKGEFLDQDTLIAAALDAVAAATEENGS
jgi:hypothetical protein